MNPAALLMVDVSGTRLTAEERDFLAEVRPGGVCLFGRNVVDRFQVSDLVAELRSLAGDDLLVAVDQEGGGVVRIVDVPYPPSAMALGAADDLALTEEVAFATARALAALGVNVDFAPVADVNSNSSNPVIADRSFGADPERVARHVVAFTRGLQRGAVAATIKHFPGHGDTAVDSHLTLPRLDRTRSELERLELPPFKAGIAAGVACVMSAHIVLPAIDPDAPATLSSAVIEGLLRRELGFEGVIFSDALDMKAIAARWGQGEAAVAAIAAGIDMPIVLGPLDALRRAVALVASAVADGAIGRDRAELSLKRLAGLSRRFPGDGWGARAPGSAGEGAAAGDPDAPSSRPAHGQDLMRIAADRGLVAMGDLPVLSAGDEVAVIAASVVRQSAATQALVDAAAPFVTALREQGLNVRLLEYDPARPLAERDRLLAAAKTGAVTIFASTNRTPLSPEQIVLGRSVAAAAREFLHVALWNPYTVAELPGPALVTFGWREASAQAAATALTGGGTRAWARPPVPLATLDG